jgi:Protein of unknown function (DUF3775)
MTASQVVTEVISLAKAAKTARAREATGSSEVKTLSAEDKQLRDFVGTQPPKVIFLLTALMYLGRGDFNSKEEFLDYLTDVPETFGTAKAAERQLLAKEPLAEYLQRGLHKLHELGLDADRLAA